MEPEPISSSNHGWPEKCRLSFPVRPHITHEANGCVYRLDNVAFQGRKLVMAKSINRILNNRVDSISNERVMFSFNDIASGAQPLGHARLNGGLEFSVSRFQRHRRANGRVELRKLFESFIFKPSGCCKNVRAGTDGWDSRLRYHLISSSPHLESSRRSPCMIIQFPRALHRSHSRDMRQSVTTRGRNLFRRETLAER